MGDHHVSKFEDSSEKQAFTKNLLSDLKALDLLVKMTFLKKTYNG